MFVLLRLLELFVVMVCCLLSFMCSGIGICPPLIEPPHRTKHNTTPPPSVFNVILLLSVFLMFLKL